MENALIILLPIYIFIFGTVIGSFLNVVIYRTPIHESLVKGRSHCTTCGKQIKNRDLIPIISWLWLGGKCRYCKSKISFRYTFVEALTGLLYLTAYLVFGLDIKLLYAIVLFPVLVVLSFIDIDHMEIPYWCSITITAMGILSVFFPLDKETLWCEHFIGAAVIAVPFAVLALFGAMGGGDVQLIAAAGLLLGFKIIPAAFIGVCIGAVYGIILKVKTKDIEAAGTQAIKESAESWYSELSQNGKGLNDNKNDVIVGEITDGKVKIETDFFSEKDWTEKPSVDGLEKMISEKTKENECVFRFAVNGGKIEKVKFSKRIVFGPSLAIGICIAFLIGSEIISGYLNLMQ